MVVIRGFHWAIHSRPKKAPPILLAVANRHRANLALISLPHRHAPLRCEYDAGGEAWSDVATTTALIPEACAKRASKTSF